MTGKTSPPGKTGGPAFFLLLPILAGILAGCAARAVLPPGAAAGLEAALRPPGEAIAATARIEVTSQGRRYVREAALLMKGPSSLRLEFLPPLGPPDLFLVLSGRELRAFIPAQGAFYAGRAEPANIARFLFLEMTTEEIVALLMGRLPLPAWHLEEGGREGPLFRLDLKGSGGLSRSLWLDGSRRLVRTILYGQDGAPLYTAEFGDHAPLGGTELPRRVKIEWGALAATVIYREAAAIEAGEGAFTLEVPAGIKPRPLD